MIGTRHVVAFLVVNLAAGIPLALAREAEEPAPEKVGIRTAVEKIAKEGKVNILVGRGLDEAKVVFGDSDARSWREEMYEAADQAKADVWPLGEETFVIYAAPRVTMEFECADSGVVLDLAARNTGTSYMATTLNRGIMNIHVKDQPFREVVTQVAKEMDLLVLQERGWIWRISTPEHERRIAARPLPAETLNALGLGCSRPEIRKRVSLDIKEGKPSDTVCQVSKAVGLRMTIDRELDREVITLKLTEAPWREALEAIAWKTGGTVWDDGKGSVSIRRVGGLNMEFVQADVKVVLPLIARNAGIRLQVDEHLQGSCGFNVCRVSWRDVIYSLSRKHPFHLRVKPDGTFVAEVF